MTICSIQELETSSLRDLLRKNCPDFNLQESNSCFRDVIERFEDCPEGLADFDTSDWLNMCEPYNHQLLDRWEENQDDIIQMFEEFKIAYGYESTLEALRFELIEDPLDLAMAMTNASMTYAARVLLAVLEE